MSEARCPHCGEVGRLPAGFPEEAEFRCPWCGETFAAAAVESQLPPLFELVKTDVADEPARAFAELAALAAAGKTATENDVSEDEGGPDEQARAEGNAGEDVPGFAIVDAHSSLSTAARSARSASGERQAGWEMAKIVGGALLAIPAAAMILLWLPGKWQRDPLGIGPKIGSFAPWLVPANLRPSREEADASDDGEAAAGPSDERLPALPDSSERRARTTPRRQGPTTVTAASPSPAQRHKKLSTAAGSRESSESAASKGPTVTAMPADDSPSEESEVAAKAEVSPMAIDDGDAVGVYNSPTFEVDEFESALEAAESAWDAWDGLAGDSQLQSKVRDRIREELLKTLYELGEISVYVNPEAPEIPALAKRAGSLMEKLAGDAKLLAYIGNQSVVHLEQSPRSTNGILVFGTVSKVSPHGRLFETQLDLASRLKKRIPVLSIADPTRLYAKNRRILVLGTVVDQPALRVAGYQGDAPQVVVGGLPYVLPQ